MAELMTDTNTTPVTDPAPATNPAPVQSQDTNPAPANLSPEESALIKKLLGGNTQQPQTTPANNPASANANPEPPQTPDNAAFANMRIQNKTLNDALARIAPYMGVDLTKIDGKNPNALVEAVVAAAAKKQVEATTQPGQTPATDPNLVTQLFQLQQENQQVKADACRANAINGFNQVVAEYKLDKKGLDDFINQLVVNKINPYEDMVNLPVLYKQFNQDKIIEARVAAELAKRQEQAQHTTTPNGMSGGPTVPQSGDQIRTVNGLTALLNRQMPR